MLSSSCSTVSKTPTTVSDNLAENRRSSVQFDTASPTMGASAKAVFEADSGKFDAALVRIQTSMLKLQKGITSVFVAFKSLKVAGEIIGSQFEQVKKAFDLGGELQDLSARTGIAVGDLAVLRQEFANSGKSAEDIGPAFAKMQKSLAEGKGADVIQKMGINLDELKRQTPTEQFHTLGAAITKLESPLDRAHAATAIFGKSGAELLSVFSDGNFGDAAAQVGSQAQILQRDSALFDDVSDKLNLVGTKVQGFFVGVADKVAPVLKPLLDKMATMDFAQWGQQIGDVVAFLVQAFADGSIGDILLQTLKIAFATAGNIALGIFTSLGQVLWQLLAEAVKNAVFMFQVVTTADFWKGLGNALLASAQAFIAMMLDGVAKILGVLRHVPGIGGKIGAAADSVTAEAQSLRQSAAANSEQSASQLGPIFDQWKQRMTDEIANVIGAAKEGFGQGMSVFDTGAMNTELEAMMGKVFDKVQTVSEKSLAEAPAKQINAVGDELLNTGKDKVSHLQRIGGGGLAGAADPARMEQKKTNTLLGDVRGLLRDIRGKIGPSNHTSEAVFG